MSRRARELAVFTTEPEMARHLPRRAGLHYFPRLSMADAECYQHIFVLVALRRVAEVSEFVRRANQQHHLRALMLFADGDAEFLPQALAEAGLRTVRNMLVHHDFATPRRVLTAYCIGAEKELIATARISGRELVVVNCTAELFRFPAERIGALARMSRSEVGDFRITEDGAVLHWPAGDIHLGLEDLRAAVDPDVRQRMRARKTLADRRTGAAVAATRKAHCLTQRQIAGLSERQVRRIEKGEGTSISALEHLATAHRMSLGDYLDEIATTGVRRARPSYQLRQKRARRNDHRLLELEAIALDKR